MELKAKMDIGVGGNMNKTILINAGELVKRIIDSYKNKGIDFDEDLNDDDADSILFDVGFPNQTTDLKVQW